MIAILCIIVVVFATVYIFHNPINTAVDHFDDLIATKIMEEKPIILEKAIVVSKKLDTMEKEYGYLVTPQMILDRWEMARDKYYNQTEK